MNLGRMMVTEELELEIFEVLAISFGDEYIFERSFMCATDDSKESFFVPSSMVTRSILSLQDKILQNVFIQHVKHHLRAPNLVFCFIL